MKGSHGENREPLWEDAIENCVKLFLIINSRRESIVRFASSSKHLCDSDLIWRCHSQFITTSIYSFSGLTKKNIEACVCYSKGRFVFLHLNHHVVDIYELTTDW